MIPSLAYIGVFEGLLVGLLTGASVLAVVAYYHMLQHGRPEEGFGRSLLNGVYGLIRIAHSMLFVLVLTVVLIFGFADGVVPIQQEYGLKLFILILCGVVAIGMYKKKFNVHYASAINAGSWTFLSLYHYYNIALPQAETLLVPSILFVLTLAVFQGLFACIRKYTIGTYSI